MRDLEVVKEEKVGEDRERSRDGVELVFLGGDVREYVKCQCQPRATGAILRVFTVSWLEELRLTGWVWWLVVGG